MTLNMKNKNRIVFLDVDGVLNTSTTVERTKTGEIFVDETLLNRLVNLCNKTNAKVIISSDWRFGANINADPSDKSNYNELIEKLSSKGISIVENPCTEMLRTRGKEIQDCISKLGDVIESFVILDDWDDVEPFSDNFVHVSAGVGLTDEDVELAIQILMEIDNV